MGAWFAPHLPVAGIDLRTIQRLPGSRIVRTTLIFIHVSCGEIGDKPAPPKVLPSRLLKDGSLVLGYWRPWAVAADHGATLTGHVLAAVAWDRPNRMGRDIQQFKRRGAGPAKAVSSIPIAGTRCKKTPLDKRRFCLRVGASSLEATSGYILAAEESSNRRDVMKAHCKRVVLAAAICFPAMQACAGTEDIKASNNQVGIQYVNTDVNYKETLPDGTTADTENGHVPGFGLSVSAMKNLFFGNDYIQAQFARLNGNTRYAGSSLGPGAPGSPIGAYGSLGQSDGAQITDLSARYGKGFVVGESYLITPYVEIGHHQWKRSLNTNCVVTAVANCASSEKYENSYWGVGALSQTSPATRWVLAANVFVGRTFSSSISGTGQNGATAASASTGSFGSQGLGNDVIYKLGLSADYGFTKQLHGSIGVDYVSFDYGRSALFSPDPAVPPYAYEPDSSTRYTTITLGLGYPF